MAEERTLGLARAQDLTTDEGPSKEELQRRLGEARDSITNTVSEIKETVANQVQAVKDTLDWREQFKRRPVVWSAAALGAGFCTGYCIANYVKGDEHEYHSAIDRYGEETRHYATQGIASSAPMTAPVHVKQGNGTLHDTGPNFFQKLTILPGDEDHLFTMTLTGKMLTIDSSGQRTWSFDSQSYGYDSIQALTSPL